MIKWNTQTNDMATMANNWQTPGASNPGRYNTPPLTRDLRTETEGKRDEVKQELKRRSKASRALDENDENQKLTESDRL